LTWIKRRARRIVRRGSGHDTPAEIAQGDTIGTSRDECVIVRKMAKVDSLDQPLAAAEAGGEHG
jgi:hypothetical protein